MRIMILHDVTASPDHNHTRLYKTGEQHEVDSSLMPQWLADVLVAGGAYVPVKGFVPTPGEGVQSIPKEEVPAAKYEDKPVDRAWTERHAQMHYELFRHDQPVDSTSPTFAPLKF